MITKHAEETYLFAQELAASAQPQEVYALQGDLGAGKTVFCQGFAAGLGIRELVNSPTFTIVQEYRSGRLPLFHFDVYRLDDAIELEEIGFEEYISGEGVCLIEWAERVAPLLPKDTIWIEIEKLPEEGPDTRRIRYREANCDGLFADESLPTGTKEGERT